MTLLFRTPSMRSMVRSLQWRSIGTWIHPEGAKQGPLVLVLGFAFSHDKQIAKFAQVHASNGRPCLRYTLPAEDFFTYNQPKQREQAESLIQELKKVAKERQDDRVIIHTISNNGFGLYIHVAEAMDDDAQLRRVGAIFDSGPSVFNLKAFNPFKRLTQDLDVAVRPQWYYPPLFYFYLQVATEGKGLFQAIKMTWDISKETKKNWVKFRPRHLTPAEFCIKDTRRMPRLFLYSDGDWIIAPVTIFEYIGEKWRSEGNQVFAHNFKTSGHVQHNKLFPDVYQQKVQELVQASQKHFPLTKATTT